MNLIIDADLTEPPSEISVFRDITLYSTMFLKMQVLLACDQDMKDLYWYWLKKFGAYDYIQQIIRDGEEVGVIISPENYATIKIKHLRVENLNFIISRLNTFQ